MYDSNLYNYILTLTNISLDLFGEVRNYFQYAAEIKGGDCTEDDIAHLRLSREFYNCILVEQPNTDFAYIIIRQFLFDVFHQLNLEQLRQSSDERLASIAVKSLKEATYHVRFSSDWVRRLGDGTEESHQKMQQALNDLYPFCYELTQASAVEIQAFEAGYGTDIAALKETYLQSIQHIIKEATLTIPDLPNRYTKGKEGYHTEYLDYILQEFQYMQKTYPNMQW